MAAFRLFQETLSFDERKLTGKPVSGMRARVSRAATGRQKSGLNKP
jgi:hypothetical protein